MDNETVIVNGIDVAQIPPVNLKKFPSTLLSLTICISDRQKIMRYIINNATTISWNESFVHGKMILFVDCIHASAFNFNGGLNMFKQPKLSTFKTAITSAKKVLEELILYRHSPGVASDEERYLEHLLNIIES